MDTPKLQSSLKKVKKSRRYFFTKRNFKNIIQAIDEDGHCILENVWNTKFIANLCAHSDNFFNRIDQEYDQTFEKNSAPKENLDQYFGSFYGLVDPKVDQLFYRYLQRTKLPQFFYEILKGDFVVMRNERCIRKVDPHFPVRISRFHTDGQLQELAQNGYRSTKEFTVWSPLVDVLDEYTPRLMLISRNDTENYMKFIHSFYSTIDGKRIPLQILGSINIDLEKHYEKEIVLKTREVYEKISYEFEHFSPHLKRGDCIIFESGIFHSTYLPEKFSKKRLSMDFRVIGDHPPSKDPKWNGEIYRKKFYGFETHDYQTHQRTFGHGFLKTCQDFGSRVKEKIALEKRRLIATVRNEKRNPR